MSKSRQRLQSTIEQGRLACREGYSRAFNPYAKTPKVDPSRNLCLLWNRGWTEESKKRKPTHTPGKLTHMRGKLRKLLLGR